MKNFHQKTRLAIALISIVIGAVFQELASILLDNFGVAILIACFIWFIILGCWVIAVSTVVFKADNKNYVYTVSDEGVVSLDELMRGAEESDDTEEVSVEIEMPPIPTNPPLVGVVVFDVENSVPMFEDQEPLVATTAIALVDRADAPRVELKPPVIPAMPTVKPSSVSRDQDRAIFRINMADFLEKPETDGSFLIALTNVAKEMSDKDILAITGKSYGLGARGVRTNKPKSPARAVTHYTKSDVNKMILKFISSPSKSKDSMNNQTALSNS